MEECLVLRRLSPGLTVDEVQQATEPPLHVPASPTEMALGVLAR
jgi:acyl CoA:acetate/3-ketoacid CoA transferase beta subunit